MSEKISNLGLKRQWCKGTGNVTFVPHQCLTVLSLLGSSLVFILKMYNALTLLTSVFTVWLSAPKACPACPPLSITGPLVSCPAVPPCPAVSCPACTCSIPPLSCEENRTETSSSQRWSLLSDLLSLVSASGTLFAVAGGTFGVGFLGGTFFSRTCRTSRSRGIGGIRTPSQLKNAAESD